MSYKARNRKEIKLPSGATCFIRKPSAQDYALLGDIPLAFSEPRPGEDKKQTTPSDIKRGIAVTKMILTRCVSPITFGSEVLTIVDKESFKTKDDEISIDELDQEDASAIVNAVNEFAQLTKEAAQKAKPFPQEPKDGNSGASNG